MDADELLGGLTDAQRHAVTVEAAPLCILAGAGSGKTRVLTRRIAHRAAVGDVDPRRVLAITFTRKAAGELRSRLWSLGLRDSVTAGTFHAIAWAQLRRRWEARGVAEPALLERKVGTVARLLPGRSGPTAALDITGEIEWASARMVSPELYPEAAADADRRVQGIDAATVAATYQRYLDHKSAQRLVDFDDLLRLAAGAMRNDEEWAASQRWLHRHLFVDEFQDVNPLQLHLLRAWLGPSTDLCVVGDPNQAIYAWNGADASALTDFAGHFGGTSVALDENFRSTGAIVSAGNAVLQGGGLTASLRPPEREGPLPTVTELPDDAAEAEHVAHTVTTIHRSGGRWRDQAILARTNALATEMAEALRRRGIPVALRGGTSLLDRPDIAAVLRSLQATGGELGTALADLEAQAHQAGTGGDDDDDDAAEGESERGDALLSLVRLGREFLSLDAAGDISAFLTWLRRMGESPTADADAVDVSTFHAAKGLEWPVVHLVGLEQGLVPIGHARTRAAQAEERRLLYVGVTRAERALHCTWSATRTFGTRTAERSVSPYLEEIGVVLADLAAGRAPSDPRRHLAQQRAVLKRAKSRATPRTSKATELDALSEADRALFEALRVWRSGIAKAAGNPAFTVLGNESLIAVAERRPRGNRELLAVKGIGPVKVERYGAEVLRIVAEHGR